FFQAEDGIRDDLVTGVQTCALPIWGGRRRKRRRGDRARCLGAARGRGLRKERRPAHGFLPVHAARLWAEAPWRVNFSGRQAPAASRCRVSATASIRTWGYRGW